MAGQSLADLYTNAPTARTSGQSKFSLAQMARDNPDEYKKLSPSQRLELLQGQIEAGEPLSDADGSLLKMLRRRVEREGAARPQTPGKPAEDASQWFNPFDVVGRILG